MLSVKHVSVRVGDKRIEKIILNDVSFNLEPNQWLMIIGGNGAGKSTLVRAVAQSIGYAGEVLLCGRNARAMKPAERATMLGVLSQSPSVTYDFSVRDIVRLGRYAHSKADQRENARMVDYALEMAGLVSMRGQPANTLSGGELQRVFLAQLFAQNPRVMILDEPASHLDIAYQDSVFRLIDDWRNVDGRAVVSVVHDISLAKAYGTHALALRGGSVAAYGSIGDVTRGDVLRDVYGFDVDGYMRRMLGLWG